MDYRSECIREWDAVVFKDVLSDEPIDMHMLALALIVFGFNTKVRSLDLRVCPTQLSQNILIVWAGLYSSMVHIAYSASRGRWFHRIQYSMNIGFAISALFVLYQVQDPAK